MKKILSGIIICFLVNIPNLLSQDCYYEMTPAYYNCGSWISNQIAVTYFSECPSCPIEVKYSYRECTNNNCNDPHKIIQVHVYSIDWGWDDCSCLMLKLFPGWPLDYGDFDREKFYKLHRELQSNVAQMLFENFFNSLNAIEKEDYECDMNPDCQMPTSLNCGNYEIYYTNPDCQSICIYRYNFGTTTTPIYRMGIAFHPCNNSENCCEHKRLFCMCKDGNEYYPMVTEESSFFQGSCQNTYPPNDWCTPYGDPYGTEEWRFSIECQIFCPE